MKDTSHVRNELARTGLLTIQDWFDHGSALLVHGPLGDWQTLVIMAERHLIAVNAALRDGNVDADPLATQLDATIEATNAFWYAALAWCSRHGTRMDRTLERAMDRIYEKIDQARVLLDPPKIVELTHARAIEALAAVPPVLELLRHDAQHALVELGGKDAHVTAIVERVTRELELRVDHAEFLVDAYGGDVRFAQLIEVAIAAVETLQKAISERVRVPHERLDRVIIRLVGLHVPAAA
jgi:hypothetical protein